MSFYSSTSSFFTWFSFVSRTFWSEYSLLTAVAVVSSVISRIAGLIAFILPLKILLLATSTSVPEYLTTFVAPVDKSTWIIWLSVSAFLFYALAVSSELLADKFSSLASAKIMIDANTINISGDQSDRVKNFYSTFSDVWARGVFSALALIAITLLNPRLTLAFGVIFLVEFLFSAFFLRDLESGTRGKFSEFITGSYKAYLSLLMPINFLISFVVLLAPFLMGSELNVIVTVVSIILARQFLASLSGMIASSVKIFTGRERIEPLIFRHIQVQQKELQKTASLRQATEDLMSVDYLLSKVDLMMESRDVVSVEWVDPLIIGVTNLKIVCDSTGFVSNGSQCSSFRLQLFGPNWRHLLKNENVLFRHLKRSDIGAPELVLEFDENDFHCQLLSLSDKSEMTPHQWKTFNRGMLEQHWSIQPPAALISDYVSSHQLLHQRFDRKLVAKAEIACSNEHIREVFSDFLQRVPEVQSLLKKFPMYIRNQDFHPANAVTGSDGESLLICWGRWSIQPIGVKLPSGISDSEVEEIIGKVRIKRNDIPDWFGVGHVNFAVKILRIEELLKRQSYVEALSEMEMVLGSSVLGKKEVYA